MITNNQKTDHMIHQKKNDVAFLGFFAGFLLFLGLLEEQRKQTSRLRDLRKRLATENGLETDMQNLRNDWQKIKGDLQQASEKVVDHVR
jgi:hypothetical protein